jgi:uncharacterized protein (DUF342 family)
MVIYSSEYIEITKLGESYYIKSMKKGLTIDQLIRIISMYKQISITNYTVLKLALLNAPASTAKFGIEKERIIVEITPDELKAFITLNVDENELAGNNKMLLVRDIVLKLRDKGVVFGVKHESFMREFLNGEQFQVAEGILPINGKDAEIKLYEIKESKPEIREDGNVDHYELNLINRVDEGAWLGERYDPTNGTEGKTIKGTILNPLKGKMIPLQYDKKSVVEKYENGITRLYAKRKGAVYYEGGKIGVSNYLEITENVDFKTGNVDFEGFLTVKGSIEDSFSVYADNDIEILGDFGIGSVKEITSRNGSIYVKGGIAGKNKAVIRSDKDIYTKFISEATVICKGKVHVGLYCMGSNIIAKEVVIDSPKGQIIGGNIQAEVSISVTNVGSKNERKTCLTISGFSRSDFKERLQNVSAEIVTLKDNMTKCKQEMNIYASAMERDKSMAVVYEGFRDRFFEMRDDLVKLEDEKKALTRYLKVKGEGEISINKKAYPGTVIEMRGNVQEINNEVSNITFYIIDNTIKYI